MTPGSSESPGLRAERFVWQSNPQENQVRPRAKPEMRKQLADFLDRQDPCQGSSHDVYEPVSYDALPPLDYLCSSSGFVSAHLPLLCYRGGEIPSDHECTRDYQTNCFKHTSCVDTPSFNPDCRLRRLRENTFDVAYEKM